MNDSQIYIGTPNGVVLCVDQRDGNVLKGRFYHGYSTDQISFENEDQLIFEMEKFFDSICFPHPSTNMRSFADIAEGKHCRTEGQTITRLCYNRNIQKRVKVMSDQELLKRHGDMGSFIVRVQQRQNSSMQGRLTWVEKNKTVCFRSAWEMIRLINSALDMEEPQPESEKELPEWEE